ncbi:MAG: hypothetical protein JXB20_05930, partial [Bacilli bacterium]|nr:hypothetical protein [Bacilli bacterium]
MKRKISVVIIILISIVTIGCYKSRVELFTIPIVAGTYSYGDSEGTYFLDKQITTMEVIFTATDETHPTEDEYEMNRFGDFSFEEIKVFAIRFIIGFDENQYDCELVFMGIANP